MTNLGDRPVVAGGFLKALDERNSPGAELHVGEAIIRLGSLHGRCHMTTVDSDTPHVDRDVARDIVRQFGGELAINADVVRGGTIQVGDPVRVVFAHRY